MPTFGNFLYTQLVLKIPIPTASFASKTVIITGANSGLGREAAKHVLRLGASKVILGCRDLTKGHRAKQEIESLTGASNKDDIEVWNVDLESPASIRSFADKANSLPRLDVVISNAGIQNTKFETTYGTERTVAVNVVGTFLLALQLMPKLKETARDFNVTPHLTFVGSALYDVAKYPEGHDADLFGWIGDKEHFDSMNQYNLSKLLLLHAVIKLASHDLTSSNKSPSQSPAVIINSLDPCFCKTDLASGLTGGLKIALKVFELLFARSAEQGSRLVVAAASAGPNTHGKYMRGGTVNEYQPFITNEVGQQRSDTIWEQLSAKLEQLQPGIPL